MVFRQTLTDSCNDSLDDRLLIPTSSQKNSTFRKFHQQLVTYPLKIHGFEGLNDYF